MLIFKIRKVLQKFISIQVKTPVWLPCWSRLDATMDLGRSLAQTSRLNCTRINGPGTTRCVWSTAAEPFDYAVLVQTWSVWMNLQARSEQFDWVRTNTNDYVPTNHRSLMNFKRSTFSSQHQNLEINFYHEFLLFLIISFKMIDHDERSNQKHPNREKLDKNVKIIVKSKDNNSSDAYISRFIILKANRVLIYLLPRWTLWRVMINHEQIQSRQKFGRWKLWILIFNWAVEQKGEGI